MTPAANLLTQVGLLPSFQSVGIIHRPDLKVQANMSVFRLHKIDVAFKELERFLLSEVSAKQAELTGAGVKHTQPDAANRNLFSRVVLASMRESDKGFNQQEIIGNLFIYLFAGVSHTHRATCASMS